MSDVAEATEKMANTEKMERRTATLRFLGKQDRFESSAPVIATFIRHSQFGRASGDDLRQDLDYFARYGLTIDDWLDGGVRGLRLTDRGMDVACGRVEIPGIACSFWSPEL